jgi:PPK2 family polyphosphate:nucleotide phosphotransferase
MTSRYRVKRGAPVRLRQHATTVRDAPKNAAAVVHRLGERLNDLEDKLSASHQRSLLVVLQGMDGSGKDEIICEVFQRVNPSRLRVAAFSEPSKDEDDHDFLWRAHNRAPARGEIVIFDRSHYEGVLVERVHGKVKPAVWRKRYDEINAFEQTLANHGTVILKFFLHMSRDEQRRRLEERLTKPEKAWKFSDADLRERKLWSQYMRAYEDALTKTSTPYAPWFVIPADARDARNVIVGTIVTEALEALKLRYPRPKVDVKNVTID